MKITKKYIGKLIFQQNIVNVSHHWKSEMIPFLKLHKNLLDISHIDLKSWLFLF